MDHPWRCDPTDLRMFKRREESRGLVGVLANLPPCARYLTQPMGVGARTPRLGPASGQLLSRFIEMARM